MPEAKKLRFPYVLLQVFVSSLSPVCDRYWDWAEPRVEKDGLPSVLYEEKLTITVAGGKTTTVNNPFSYYTYQTGIPPDFENDTSPRVRFNRAHPLLFKLLSATTFRPTRPRTSRIGLGLIDMLQATRTPRGATLMLSKRLHLPFIYAVEQSLITGNRALKAQAVSIRQRIGLLFAFPDGEDPATT